MAGLFVSSTSVYLSEPVPDFPYYTGDGTYAYAKRVDGIAVDDGTPQDHIPAHPRRTCRHRWTSRPSWTRPPPRRSAKIASWLSLMTLGSRDPCCLKARLARVDPYPKDAKGLRFLSDNRSRITLCPSVPRILLLSLSMVSMRLFVSA